VENDELLPRSLNDIKEQIDDFFVFEIDKTPAGCVALHYYPAERKAEMACICVHPRYENQRIGLRLMNYMEARARELGATELFCLSTQAYNYFVQKGGFRVGSPDDLSRDRRQRYDESGRRSLVLVKAL
jgi:amino-acid N-acetyltransferase